VFFVVTQRLGGYDGYGTVDAPVRMAAHRRRRRASLLPT
jgi:4-hydroxyphenylpyruvate dioxygenase